MFESWCDRARITDARGKAIAKVLHTAGLGLSKSALRRDRVAYVPGARPRTQMAERTLVRPVLNSGAPCHGRRCLDRRLFGMRDLRAAGTTATALTPIASGLPGRHVGGR